MTTTCSGLVSIVSEDQSASRLSAYISMCYADWLVDIIEPYRKLGGESEGRGCRLSIARSSESRCAGVRGGSLNLRYLGQKSI